MDRMVKYILSDMDGTLLNEKKELPKKLGAMIQHLRSQGICFGVASGRQYYNLKERMRPYGNDFLYIGENGAIMFQGDTCIYVDEIPYEKYEKAVIRLREAKDIYPVACGERCAYIEHKDKEFVENAEEYYERLEMVDDILIAAKQDRICKIAVYDKQDTHDNASVFLKGYYDGLHGALSGIHWMDLSNPGVNKGKAIRYLKDQHQLSSDDFMVFGDYMNDYEMMLECTHSYAMENAFSKIKEIAKYQTLSNDDDGVIKALCEVFQLDYNTL